MTGASGLTDLNRAAALPGGASILERVRREMGDYSEAERRVARALISDYPMPGLETVARFAQRAQTSGPTILRFIRRLGFEVYSDFQESLRGEIQVRLQGPLSRYGTGREDGGANDLPARISQALGRNIDTAERELRREDLVRIVDRLSDLDRNVFCLGGRFSWLIASYLHHYLRELRPGVRMIRDGAAAWADYLVDVRKGDVLVVFDFRRYQPDVIEFARGAAALDAEVILVTDIWHSPISGFATFVLPCPVSIPSAFDSGVSGLAIAEILTAGVVEALGDRARNRISELEDLRRSIKLGS
jgi:DNA-binding MurR/RpiR family transcriptional regulator